ncbi:MAG: tandem-95 repeat protein [Promethearchaeota archaeon]
MFETTFQSYVLNYTVPDVWAVSTCYNVSSADTHGTSVWDQPGDYKVVSVDNAGNSTNWRLLLNSPNYANNISILVNSMNVTEVNYSNDVFFKAGFDGPISGDVNLTVYSPSGYINYTSINSSIVDLAEVSFPVYDVSTNLTEYGVYSAQFSWSNATYAAYWEQNFTILADTDLSLISPAQNSVYNPSDSFNIVVYYNDTGLDQPIDGATIYYSIEGGSWQSITSNNGTSGYYEIPIDCSTLGNGDKSVDITSNRTFYNNQTLKYNFHINYPPSIINKAGLQNDPRFTQDEDFGTFQIDLTSNESDNEDSGTDLDWYVSGLNESLVWVTGNYSDDDILTFHSVANVSGSDIFTLHLVDSRGLEDTVDITITVNPVNDDPTIVNATAIRENSNWTVDEDFGEVQIDLSGNRSDIDDPTNVLYWSTSGWNSSLATLSINGDIITINSLANVSGDVTFTLELHDDSDGLATTSITFTVNPVNDDPTIVNATAIRENSNWTVDEDFGEVQIDLIGNRSDIDDPTNVLYWSTSGWNSSLATLTINGDIITINSLANVSGDVTFTLELHDDSDGVATTSITFTVNPVNDDPTIVNATAIRENANWTVDEDFGEVQIDLSGNRSDIDDPTNVLYWSTSGWNSSLATLTINGDIITINSLANISGDVTFTLELHDDSDGVATTSITFTVNPVNDAPWISNKTIIITNSTWSQWENFEDFVFYLKSYEHDVDNPDSELTWSIDSGYSLFIPTYNNSADTITFSHVLNTVGTETFTLRLTDAGGLSDTVDVVFNVTGKMDIDIMSNNNNSVHYNDDTFKIDVYIWSNTRNATLTDCTISYSINGGNYRTDHVENLNNGHYNITIYGWNITDYGPIQIDILAERSHYLSNSTIFKYTKYFNTTQNLPQNTFNVVRGSNITISADYLDNNSIGIPNAELIWDPNNPNFIYSWQDMGGGTYNLILNSTNVEGSDTAYTVVFNITSNWNKTQIYTVNIYVYNRTAVWIVSLEQSAYSVSDNSSPYDLYYGEDIVVTVEFIDLDNSNSLIIGGLANLTFNGQTYYDLTDNDGYYTFTISTASLNAADNYLITSISINKTYYETSSNSTQFDINPCPTIHANIHVYQYGEELVNTGGHYQAWYGADINVTVEYRNQFTNALVISGTGTLTFGSDYIDNDADADGTYSWIVAFASENVGSGYTFNINLSKTNFVSELFNVIVDVSAVPTYITRENVTIDGNLLNYNNSDNTYYEEAYGTDIFIYLRWYNAKDNTLISSASTRLVQFNGVSYATGTESNGIYGWQIDFTDSNINNNTVNAQFQKANYESASIDFGIWLLNASTQLNVWAVYNGNWNSTNNAGTYDTYQVYSTFVYVRYLDLNHSTWINGTNGNATLVINGIHYYNTSGTADGYFMFEIAPGTLSNGLYSVQVYANHTNYYNAQNSFNLNYIDINTTIENVSYYNDLGDLQYNALTNTYTAKKGYNITIVVRYRDIIHSLGIGSADAVLDRPTPYSDLLNTTVSDGTVTFYLDESNYNEKETYLFTITINKSEYQTYQIQFNIYFVTWLTDADITRVNQTVGQNISYYGANRTYEILRSYNTTITAYYQNSENGSYIADASADLWFNGQNYHTTTNSSGYAVWVLPTYNMTPQIYSCYIDFSKDNHENAHIDFELYLKLIPTTGELKNIYQPDHAPWQYDNLTFADGAYQGYMSYNLSVNCTYYDTNHSQWINDATGVLIFKGVSYYVYSGVDGVYTWSDIPVFNETGLFQINITIYKTDYENVSFSFMLNISEIPTSALFDDLTQPDHTGYSSDTLVYKGAPDYYYVAYKEYGVLIALTYYDLNNSVGINNANGSFWFNGHYYENLTGSNGNYTWFIPSSDMDYGVFLINVTFKKEFYQTSYYAFNISIEKLPTNASFYDISQPDHNPNTLPYLNASAGYKVYVHYNLVINMTYDDLNNSLHIADAQSAWLIINGINISSDYFSSATGIYGWTIPRENLTLGTYDIMVFFDKENYENASYNITITCYNLPTDAQFNNITQPAHAPWGSDMLPQNGSPSFDYQAYRGYDTQITITYFDLNNSVAIGSALFANLTFNGQVYIGMDNSGVYTWTIPTNNASTGTYLIVVQFLKDDYELATYSFNLTVKLLPTSLTFDSIKQPDHNPNMLPTQGSYYLFYTHYGLLVTYTYYDTNNSVGINNAQARLTYNGIDYYNNTGSNGIYSWLIPKSQLVTGDQTISIFINKTNYESRSATINVRGQLLPTTALFDDIVQPDHTGYETDTLVYVSAQWSYVGYKPYYVKVTATFFDLNNSVGISGAQGRLSYMAHYYYDNVGTNGNYTFNIPASDLVTIVRINVQIQFTLSDYETATYNFNLTINPLPTNVTQRYIYQDIPGHDGNLTRVGNNLIAYTYFDNVTFELGYWDTNNSIFLYGAGTTTLTVTESGYSDSAPQIDMANHVFRWVLPLNQSGVDPGSVFHVKFDFIYDSNGNYSSQTITYNISMQLLTANATLQSIIQFNATPSNVSSRYILYNDEPVYIQYLFKEMTFDIPVVNNPANLSLVGSDTYWIEYSNSSGIALWNITLGLTTGDYTLMIQLDPNDFNPITEYIYIRVQNRYSNYSDLSVANYLHTLKRNNTAGILFETAYTGNDLIISVIYYDNYTYNTITDGTVFATLNSVNYYATFNSTHYIVVIPQTNIQFGLLQIQLNMTRIYFHNISVSFNVSVDYKSSYYNNLYLYDFGHSLNSTTLTNGTIQFSTAYMGNDLVVSVRFYDNYSQSLIDSGIITLIMGAHQYTASFTQDTVNYGTTQNMAYIITIPKQDLIGGTITLELYLNKTNYYNTSFTFNVVIIPKAQIKVSFVGLPQQILAGEFNKLSIYVEYKPYNSDKWLPATDLNITLLVYFGENIEPVNMSITTNASGYVSFNFQVPRSAQFVNYTIIIQNVYNIEPYVNSGVIQVIPPKNPLNWLIYIFLIIGAFTIVIAATKKGKKPKAKETAKPKKKKLPPGSKTEQLEAKKAEKAEKTAEKEPKKELKEKITEKTLKQPDKTKTTSQKPQKSQKKIKLATKVEVLPAKKTTTSPKKTTTQIKKSQQKQTPSKSTQERLKEKKLKIKTKVEIKEQSALSPLEKTVETTVIRILSRQTIPNKRILNETIYNEVKKQIPDITPEQVILVIDKLIEKRIIGFSRAKKNTGWKLII